MPAKKILPVWFYNLQVARSFHEVKRELTAILVEEKPAMLGMVEALGYRLPKIPGYILLRDQTTTSRANIAAYVRADLPVTHMRWVDLTETWKRTEHEGRHEPRSILLFRMAGVLVAVHHQPPRYTDNTAASQAEGAAAVVKALAPWTRPGWKHRAKVWRHLAKLRPRLVVMDANSSPGDPAPSPTSMAVAIGGFVVGRGIDNAVVRGGEVTNVDYEDKPAGVVLRSDHKHALRFDFIVASRWA